MVVVCVCVSLCVITSTKLLNTKCDSFCNTSQTSHNEQRRNISNLGQKSVDYVLWINSVKDRGENVVLIYFDIFKHIYFVVTHCLYINSKTSWRIVVDYVLSFICEKNSTLDAFPGPVFMLCIKLKRQTHDMFRNDVSKHGSMLYTGPIEDSNSLCHLTDTRQIKNMHNQEIMLSREK